MIPPLGFMIWRYPLGWGYVLPILAGYVLALWYRPACWLAVLPAILLAFDLAPWTGWLLCNETDIVLATTVIVGYLRLARAPLVGWLTPLAMVLLLLFLTAFLVSLLRGLWPLPAPDLNVLTDYTSPYNGLRVAKGLLWALLLLPLLQRTLTGENLRRYLLPGLLAALALVSSSVFWERLTFTGLLDFASDYRVTGPFSAMHTGGATLDGSLALLMPFGVLWLLQAKRFNHAIFAAILIGFGTYAVMATFSRGLYLGFGLALAILGFSLLPGRDHSRRYGRQSLLILSLLCLTGYLLFHVFATGGYRTLAATLGLLVGALFVGSLPRPLPSWFQLALGLVVCLVSEWVLWQALAKGAYLAFGLAAIVWGVGILVFGGGHRSLGAIMGMIGFIGMALGTGLVAQHWGGEPALVNALAAIGLAVGLVLMNFYYPIWRWERSTWVSAVLIAMVLGIGIPIVGNYYMGERLSQAPRDWEYRLRHWQASLMMMDTDWATAWWGMGVGRFPAIYFWRNPDGEFPGNFQYETENGNRFLRISGARHPRGYGEPLRIGQRVQAPLYVLYTLSLDVRAPAEPAKLNVNLCQKWLLYASGCSGSSLRIDHQDWQHVELPLNTLQFAGDFWGSYRTVQFTLHNSTGGAALDVDNIQLRDPATGAELLANSDFSQGGAHWFFTSDRHHLPWHIKNLWLNLFFDQGWMGVGLFGLLTLLGLARAFLQFRKNHQLLALVLFAALSGFLAVGLFDSLLDAPRLALLYYLILFSTLLEPFPSSGMVSGRLHDRHTGSAIDRFTPCP
ncbi:MAG: hypothetical protein H6975_03195 [Gammaproteobacteria bacterium]|nr:hypothetical protein [Gammaproteobacteria bacterium]